MSRLLARLCATLIACVVAFHGHGAAQTREAVAVEFDLSEAELQLLEEGARVRFVVGYFADPPGGEEPLFSYTVDRMARTADGRLRVALRPWDAPAGGQLVVRMRTVTPGGTSPWSAPSGRVAAETLARRPAVRRDRRAERTDRRAGRSAKEAAVVADEVRTNAALRSALAERFPGVNLDEAAAGYPNLQTFIGALYAASRHGIPFDDLKPLTMTRQRTSLAPALQKLRPTLDAAAAAREAFDVAQTIVRESRRDRR